jgi:hypothetical protein
MKVTAAQLTNLSSKTLGRESWTGFDAQALLNTGPISR